MTAVIKQLYAAAAPDLTTLPLGSFRYSDPRWVARNLPPAALTIIATMSDGLVAPRVTYIHRQLAKSERFGHGRWHLDGRGEAEEMHRLLTFNGTPTEGADGTILTAGIVWEFSGDYYHRARPAVDPCRRLLLRISQTTLPFRNRWER